ncbi:unnamed protein product, partial [Staurois parvus]
FHYRPICIPSLDLTQTDQIPPGCGIGLVDLGYAPVKRHQVFLRVRESCD